MREDIRNLILIILVLILAAFLGYNAIPPEGFRLKKFMQYDTNGIVPI